jgi:hypothetical protein
VYIAYTKPFLLIQWNGQVILFDDLESLARAVRADRLSIATHHVLCHTSHAGVHSQTICEWIVRDDRGAVLDKTAVEAAMPGWSNQRFLRSYYKLRLHAARIGLPIPGTGRHHGRYGNYLRSPHCHAALRAHAAMPADGTVLRLTGRITRPPTNYDDIPRSDANNRNWKRHRRTRWK